MIIKRILTSPRKRGCNPSKLEVYKVYRKEKKAKTHLQDHIQFMKSSNDKNPLPSAFLHKEEKVNYSSN